MRSATAPTLHDGAPFANYTFRLRQRDRLPILGLDAPVQKPQAHLGQRIAVVLDDVPAGALAVGIPARIVRRPTPRPIPLEACA